MQWNYAHHDAMMAKNLSPAKACGQHNSCKAEPAVTAPHTCGVHPRCDIFDQKVLHTLAGAPATAGLACCCALLAGLHALPAPAAEPLALLLLLSVAPLLLLLPTLAGPAAVQLPLIALSILGRLLLQLLLEPQGCSLLLLRLVLVRSKLTLLLLLALPLRDASAMNQQYEHAQSNVSCAVNYEMLHRQAVAPGARASNHWVSC
jgi:hypothetical protein